MIFKAPLARSVVLTEKLMKPKVLSSIETSEGDRCVDVCRRDWESLSDWSAIGNHAAARFGSEEAASIEAGRRVAWPAGVIDKEIWTADREL